jgi:hypothetical protein
MKYLATTFLKVFSTLVADFLEEENGNAYIGHFNILSGSTKPTGVQRNVS